MKKKNLEVNSDVKEMPEEDITDKKRSKSDKKKKRSKSNKKKDKAEGKDDASDVSLTADDEIEDIFNFDRKDVREKIAPTGINPNPLDHLVIDDCGNKVYVRTMYVHTFPKTASFARTFRNVFNIPGVTTNVHIEPLPMSKSSRQLDKRIMVLESEEIAARKAGDTNRLRKISQKKADTEGWASAIENGENALYETYFAFTLYANSFDELQMVTSEIYNKAREAGIELSSCFAVQPEAYLSTSPLNRIYNLKVGGGMIKTTTIKRTVMDKNSLADIFNHTQGHFSHDDGVFIGYNLFNGKPFLYNIYHKSHNGFGTIVTGATGTGKSALIKMALSRYIDFDYKVISVDFDSTGNLGEYALMVHNVGGVTFQIKNDSKNILNPFELEVEMEYDDITQKEYPVLNLMDKIADLKHTFMTIIKNGNKSINLELSTFIEEIIIDCITELYTDRGIKDKDVESLFTFDTGTATRLASGKVKKQLPTIKDLYLKLVKKKLENRDEYYDRPLAITLSALKNRVKELYYVEGLACEFTKDEFEKLPIREGVRVYTAANGKEYYASEVHGIKAYFDGQTSVRVEKDTPMVNIDLSQLPEEDKPIAQQIACNFAKENFIKKNSVNPNHVQNLIFVIDECHKMFPSEDARLFMTDLYRTARKRHVSPWIITQALADFEPYKDLHAIIKNSTSKFLLKQSAMDRKFLSEVTPLTESELDTVIELGGDPDNEGDKSRKGEVCLIENDSKVIFLKVKYITETEAYIVETDAENRKRLLEKMSR